MVLLKQLLIFLFMMVLGYGMAKKGIMEEKVCSAINWLLVNIDDAIAICFTENVILLLRIYMVMNESKIIERRMQVCAQQQLIRQKIFISDVHWIMNFPMEMRSC